jgi:hypothetical protein
VIERDQAHDEALRIAREAEEEHLRIKRARMLARRKLSELAFFCAANGINFEIVRAEAKDHGSNEREDKED